MSSSFIFADVEATGPVPTVTDESGRPCVMTEFGLADYATGETFHGVLWSGTVPHPDAPALPVLTDDSVKEDHLRVAKATEFFLEKLGNKSVMVSDNPGFDAMWLNCFLHEQLGYSPFGFSSRRIGDFFAGLQGDYRKANSWKKLRITSHTHNPVDDVIGNMEAVARVSHLVDGLPERSWSLPDMDKGRGVITDIAVRNW